MIYDICNEPNGVGWTAIRNYAIQVIPVIRAIDSDAVVLVGTHGWSTFGVSGNGTLQDVVNNPLPYSNVMYTFHFYAGSHGQAYLDMLNNASNVLPVFVTEFGSQTASGDGANNFTRTQQYIDLMRTKKISWCNWNYSDDFRSGAVWQEGTCSAGPWTVSQLKPAGAWIRERMLSPADDFPGGGGGCEPVSASANDGNVPANVLDNNLNTRWSASGDGQWIQFCLSTASTVSGVQIAFYKGNERQSSFDVLVSANASTWTTVATGLQSSGSSLTLETFTFTAIPAKYVRIVGHGNNANAWNSYTEVKITSTSALNNTAGDITSLAESDVISHPNPTDGQITITYRVSEPGRVTLSIHDTGYNRTITLIDKVHTAGTHELTLDTRSFTRGVHILKVTTREKTTTHKLLKN